MFKNFMIMLRSFDKKKAFGECKSQIFVIRYRIAGRKDRLVETGRRSMRLGDDFYWLGGHSSKYYAPEVS